MEFNPADLLTKHLPFRDKLEQLVVLSGCACRGGRPASAHLLRNRVEDPEVTAQQVEGQDAAIQLVEDQGSPLGCLDTKRLPCSWVRIRRSPFSWLGTGGCRAAG